MRGISRGPGRVGWMMTAAALVFFMTIPGLALSYGGLVRRKNVLSVLAQSMGIAGMVVIIWWAVGYSLAFAPGHPWLGDLRYAMLPRRRRSRHNSGLLLRGSRTMSLPCSS